MFNGKQRIHFVGIGGAGMSGIAEVALNLGHKVSGSDIRKTEVTQRLKDLGAKIYIGHKAENIKNVDVVVTSTAISKDNPEVKEAIKNKIIIIPRVEMLAELARLKYTITIAGTHGKTTTTSLTSMVLDEGGFDPTIVIGGKLKNLKTNARLGKGEYMIAEADESDGSFLKLSPVITAVTNIDNDHLDYYGNMENLKQAFIKHINSLPFYGCAFVCTDSKLVKEILPFTTRKCITYGFTGTPDITAKDPLPEILKIRIIIGSQKKLIKSIISVLIKIFVPIKKGKSAGKILFAHKIIASREEFKISFGNKNKNKLNNPIIKIKKPFDIAFFIFSRYIFLSRLNFGFIKSNIFFATKKNYLA